MAKAPDGVVKHRSTGGTMVHSDRIDVYWKSKKDGSNIMVVRYLRVANEGKKRVVYVNEDEPTREVSCELWELRRDFESMGNRSSKF